MLKNKKLQTILKDRDKKRLFENFISLSVLQGANYILPLITLPYLVRILGPEKFGLIAFARAFIQYFNILTDYGFNLSATREISIHRDDKEKISEIFSSVMLIKFGLLLLSFIILTIIVFSFKKFRQDWEIYYLTFGMVVGQALFPVWFFQGMERMKYITFLNIIAKLIFTVFIFVFVHKVSDYVYVPLINSAGFLVAGILALWIVFKDFKISFKIPFWNSIKYQLKEGAYIFISRVSISFYTVSNIFILGLLTDNTIVGIYSAAEKLLNAIKSINIMILQVMFPYISKICKQSFYKALKVINYEIKFLAGLQIILCIFICLFAHKFILLFFGEKFENSINIFQILIFTVPIVSTSGIIGQQILLNLKLKRLFTLSIVYISFFHLIILPIMIWWKKEIGAAIAVLVAETLILIVRLIGLYKARKDIFYSLLTIGV